MYPHTSIDQIYDLAPISIRTFVQERIPCGLLPSLLPVTSASIEYRSGYQTIRQPSKTILGWPLKQYTVYFQRYPQAIIETCRLNQSKLRIYLQCIVFKPDDDVVEIGALTCNVNIHKCEECKQINVYTYLNWMQMNKEQ